MSIVAKNSGLSAAKNAKADEFYTQLSDIEREVKHYWKHFKGKTVYRLFVVEGVAGVRAVLAG